MAPQMDNTMYWMWPKRKFDSRSLVQPMTAASSSNDSWEEQAFAEDSAAGALGGCIWPPRSYTCSFCRREFRSAQALGGHMNVHRRDRARLKQSPNCHQLPSTNYQSQCHLSTLTCNPNPSDPVLPLSPSKVSSLSRPQENHTEDLYGCHRVLSGRDHGVLGLKLGRENSNIDDMGWRAPKAHFSLDLAVKSSEFLGSRSPEIDDEKEEEEEEEDDEASRRKRWKNDEPSPHIFIKSNLGEQRTTALLPFFIKTSLAERHHLNSDMIGIRSSPIMDDLDLELRLGDGPKVK